VRLREHAASADEKRIAHQRPHRLRCEWIHEHRVRVTGPATFAETSVMVTSGRIRPDTCARSSSCATASDQFAGDLFFAALRHP